MASKNYFITNSKKIAQRKIKQLINEVIIQNILIEDKWYRIERITPKEMYANMVEAQYDLWEKYVNTLLNMLEPEDNKQIIKSEAELAEEEKAKIYDNLWK